MVVLKGFALLFLVDLSSSDLKAPRNGVLERPPSVATVQTLSLMAIYEGICSGENSIETTWALMGLACKLSQSVSISNLGYMRLILIYHTMF